MKKLYQAILQHLEQGESFVQATILAQSGSAPRTAGAKMIILPDQSILGTIGGGLVEAKVQELAGEVFQTKQAVTKKFNLTGQEAGQMDMICGGRLEVLVEYMNAANQQLVAVYRALLQAMEKRQPVVLVTPLASDGSQTFLIQGDGSLTGTFTGPGEWLEELTNLPGRYPQVIQLGGQRFLAEPISINGTVYIFGAGHVSQKLALVTNLVGFRTVVLDDRQEFANRLRFPSADEVVVLASLEQACANLAIDQESYLVIVTRGHAHDKTVLAQALKTKARYIGMIGSKKKRDTIYRALQQEGFSAEDLQRVYCPIGLGIGAETPEEIAVSITAELIKVRAGESG